MTGITIHGIYSWNCQKLKTVFFSHSLCIMDAIPLALVWSIKTNTLYFMPTSISPRKLQVSSWPRLWGSWGEVGFVSRFLLWCITSIYPEAVCAVLSLGDSHSSCLELPWFSGLGSRTALIQFTMQLHNCSQSPVDLDVKQRSSCTSPEKVGGLSGQPLRTFSLGFWNGMWQSRANPDH